MVKVVLSIEALQPELTGIGRYTWELTTRIPTHPDVGSISFIRNGRLIRDPARLIRGSIPRPLSKKFSLQIAKWKCRKKVFHGPNFFLPSYAEGGVISLHDLSVFKYPETHPVERLKHYEREFSSSLSKAVQLITPTEAVRNEVIEYFGYDAQRVTAIPHGVSRDFRPRPPAEIQATLSAYGLTFGAFVLCVSTLEPRKKIDRLLQAYSRLSLSQAQSCPLVLVGGNGWLSDEIHIMISKATSEGWLRYLGFVAEADLVSLYSGARLFIYPSIYEGFGMPVSEAMASGVPVITSDKSCLPEVSGGAALLIDPDDIPAFSAAIERGCGDDCWRIGAISKGLEVVANYDWDSAVNETVRVYQSVQA